MPFRGLQGGPVALAMHIYVGFILQLLFRVAQGHTGQSFDDSRIQGEAMTRVYRENR